MENNKMKFNLKDVIKKNPKILSNILTCPNLSSFRLLTTESTSVGDLDLYLSLSPGDTEFCNK